MVAVDGSAASEQAFYRVCLKFRNLEGLNDWFAGVGDVQPPIGPCVYLDSARVWRSYGLWWGERGEVPFTDRGELDPRCL
jgi:hypothetical protein